MQNPAKVAVITGAAGGIGRALCQGFIEDGYRIAALDVDAPALSELLAQLGEGHQGFTCDLASETQIVATVAQVAARFGRIDVLVNNAALGPSMAATCDTTLEGFALALAVNTLGPTLMAREAARHMGRGAAVVNVASLAGLLANPKRNAYASSKAALISMTRSLACEWAERGIRVTAVAPGYVLTPMVAGLEQAAKVDLQQVRRRIPMGRLARPDEIAAAVRFLASAEARQVTGSVLPVDGGWACFNQPGDAHPPVASVPDAERHRPQASAAARVVVVSGGGGAASEVIAARFRAQGDTVIVLEPQAEAAVRQAFAVIQRQYGRVDVLINAALLEAPRADHPESLMSTLNRTLTAAFLSIREALNCMPVSGGVVLNIGSLPAGGTVAARQAQAAAWQGSEMLGRCQAAELAAAGVRVVNLAGAAPYPGDIAAAALFLASASASYITGATLYVDGGRSAFANAAQAAIFDDTEVA
ncbi:putative short-chain type dehydrogenase/reductase y4vI [Pseudomonas reidholzensis]|uniref:Putative short-chain type dehydrogenase/reductase y4vI n=1 Tax=Pseudomonas reidholzensis TaxID=1785162 RepID=A0A383RW24_9PSED|nr:SDR family oxidoreductase [Pseudomonas reidholzensis]SYX90854.1 putative short-chain type dehydrogenase/reductase y4vI [Pseudomonas reidholzensis]